MTTRFYVPPDSIRGDRLTLSRDESRHLSRVLRRRIGDEIEAVDGLGNWFRVKLEQVADTVSSGTIIERKRNVGEPDYHLTLGVGVLKNHTRFETLIEKASELGVARLIPLETERTERTKLRSDRLERIAIAAMKQCGRSRLLRVTEPMPFEQFVAANRTGLPLLCYEAASPGDSLPDALRGMSSRRTDESETPVLVVSVGPEGGFSEAERDIARSAGYREVYLGSRRLRTETAAIAAAAGIALYFT